MENIISSVVLKDYRNQRDCVADLLSQGCKDLGWVNDSTFVMPKSIDTTRVFSSTRGFEIHCDPIRRMFYGVDMSD
jgi:hypothetical protein